MKLWYAVMRNRDDNDWGYGSHDLDKAKKMALNLGDPEAYIAVIDDGDDPVCIDEIHMDEF